MKLYSTFEEFLREMNTLFENFVQFRGKEHKMYKYCDAIMKRFEKFMERSKVRME